MHTDAQTDSQDGKGSALLPADQEAQRHGGGVLAEHRKVHTNACGTICNFELGGRDIKQKWGVAVL